MSNLDRRRPAARAALYLIPLVLATACSDRPDAPGTPSPLEPTAALATPSLEEGFIPQRVGDTIKPSGVEPGISKSAVVKFDVEGSPTGLPKAYAGGGGLSVTGGLSATQLAQILAGPGVTVSNAAFYGASQAAAAFSGGTGIIGIEEGILLSTGRASFVPGPNSSDAITGYNGQPGDATLTGLAGRPTYDRAILEFDFVPDGNAIAFEYVFASDEYNEYAPSSYNDVFAFFVNGSNCALLPGGSPVSINNVRLGNNGHLFRNNDDGARGSINTEMDGLTVVLVCQTSVSPGTTNHMKLAIADAGDSSLDSNVFLKGASLSTTLPGQISLTPAAFERPTGEAHSATVTVRKTDNTPVQGTNITFTVTSGPSQGVTQSGNSDQNGQRTFTWSSNTGGVDAFRACFVDIDGQTKCAQGTITWKVLNTAPVPVLAYGCPTPTLLEGSPICITGGGTHDAEDDITTLHLQWAYGDGATAEGLGLINPPQHVYADNGAYTVTLTATDPKGASAATQLALTIANVAPTPTLTFPGEVLTGMPVDLLGSFTDPGADSPWGWTVTWGDGTAPSTGTSGAPGEVSAGHAYAQPGTYDVTFSVTDKDGASGSFTQPLVVLNQPPVPELSLACPGPFSEGAPVCLSASGTSDPDDDAGSLTLAWDFGDGTSATGAMEDLTPHVYDDNGVYTVTLTVTDPDGASAATTLVVPVDNAAPTVESVLAATVPEGAAYAGSVSFLDPGEDTWTALVDFGDGTPPVSSAGPSPVALNHVYADDGVYTVTVTVTDDDGGVGSNTGQVTVTNVAPTVAAPVSMTLDEGGTYTGVASFTDPGADTWSVAVDFGDGTLESFAGPGPFALSHVYVDDGTFTVTVTVTDDDGGTGSASGAATVQNVAPSVTVAATTPLTLYSGDTFGALGSFSDPGALDNPWSWSFDWGDGIDSGSTDVVVPLAGSHQYLAIGTYAVAFRVTDKNGGTGTASLSVEIIRLPVLIDIKPGSAENPINLGSNGNGKSKAADANGTEPVAILGSSTFDAALVRVETVTLGDLAGVDTPVALKKNGTYMAALEDVNGDGFVDLVLHFERASLIANDLGPATKSLTLLATASDGRMITGVDVVRPIG